MGTKITTLPAELKVQIADTLRAPSRHSDSGVAIYHKMAEDIASEFDNVADIQNFVWTCTNIREPCSRILFKSLNLSGEKRCQDFLESLDNETLSDFLRKATGVRFLRLGSYESLHWYNLEASAVRILGHFSSLTTLDLFKFPLSRAMIYSIKSLKELKTLSIRCPADVSPQFEDLMIADMHTASFSMPAVTSLSLVDIDEKAHLIGYLIKVLESSLINLSIMGTDYGNIYSESGVICSLFLANPSHIKLSSLKYLTIDFLKYKASSLRELIQSYDRLESLSVDCRGSLGFLPLFYVIDLIGNACGLSHRRSDKALVCFERWQEAPETQHPYVEGDKEYDGILSCFSCTFSNTSNGKVLEHLQLAFATGDMDLEPINSDLSLPLLLQLLFSERIAFLFTSLKKLVLSMSDEVPYNSESEIVLEREQKNATKMLRGSNKFPPLYDVTITDWRRASESEDEDEE